MGKTKFIAFDKYCKNCAHYDEDEFDPKSVCYTCLEDPVNAYSKKPISFKER